MYIIYPEQKMPEFNPLMQNPLRKHFRQPKIYIKLPSGGKFYGPNDLDMTETGEIPVYAMTAKDEIAFKTPDALLNGQSTVDVIQSCIPNIKNAWAIPSIDIDTLLIAIRIATFGEKMDVTTIVPVIKEARDYTVDLRQLLDEIGNGEFEETLVYEDLIVRLRPLNYKEWTQTAVKTFEEQRIFSIVNNQNISDEEKMKTFNSSFKKLTEITVGIILSSIVSIEIDDQIVTDPKMIQEFVENADRAFYEAVSNHIDKQKEIFNIKPRKVITSEEDQEKGAPESFEMPLVFDQSHFFG